MAESISIETPLTLHGNVPAERLLLAVGTSSCDSHEWLLCAVLGSPGNIFQRMLLGNSNFSIFLKPCLRVMSIVGNMAGFPRDNFFYQIAYV